MKGLFKKKKKKERQDFCVCDSCGILIHRGRQQRLEQQTMKKYRLVCLGKGCVPALV